MPYACAEGVVMVSAVLLALLCLTIADAKQPHFGPTAEEKQMFSNEKLYQGSPLVGGFGQKPLLPGDNAFWKRNNNINLGADRFWKRFQEASDFWKKSADGGHFWKRSQPESNAFWKRDDEMVDQKRSWTPWNFIRTQNSQHPALESYPFLNLAKKGMSDFEQKFQQEGKQTERLPSKNRRKGPDPNPDFNPTGW